jgi:hypothetical protein
MNGDNRCFFNFEIAGLFSVKKSLVMKLLGIVLVNIWQMFLTDEVKTGDATVRQPVGCHRVAGLSMLIFPNETYPAACRHQCLLLRNMRLN